MQVGCERWRTSASASPTGVTPFSSLKAASSSATVSRGKRAFFGLQSANKHPPKKGIVPYTKDQIKQAFFHGQI